MLRSALEEKQKKGHLQAQHERNTALKDEVLKLVSRSESMMGLPNEHAFLSLVLPLIQDMKKATSQFVEAGPWPLGMYTHDAQMACLLQKVFWEDARCQLAVL
eukprot:3317060-Amphidinium_carterae.2